jgi:hypothetical protein
MHCSPVRQSPAIVRALYLISFTVIPDTAVIREQNHRPFRPGSTYGRRSSWAIYCGLGATVLQPPGHCWT